MKKILLGTLCAFTFAVAAGDLWGPDSDAFPSLQVKTPQAVQCWADYPGTDSQCYTTTGGWWFGYVDGDASTKVKIGSSWQEFSTGVGITDESDGQSLISPNGLEIQFSTATPASSSAPTIAGIGFNYMPGDNVAGASIAGWGGYCIAYSSDIELQFELGWNEATYGYDTFYATLPAGTKSTDLSWNATTTDKQSLDFKKDDWAEAGVGKQPIATALNSPVSLKIRLKNGSISPKSGNFTLQQLGKKGTCGAAPIISNQLAAGSLKFEMIGKTLSISVEKPVSVQIINLRGALVHSQTISPNANKINLSALPSGMYMVRIPALGSHVSKITVK